jgi:D-glycero-D-manno-heptose 1,7-bisphosphate phosphatase
MKKLIIFDKDETLVSPASGKVFVTHPKDQIPKINPAGIAALSEHFDLYIASNQGGVEAGHKTFKEVVKEMKYCLGLFPGIEAAFFCPFFSGDSAYKVSLSYKTERMTSHEGFYRKPDAGMIKEATLLWREQHGSHLSQQEVLFVGDRQEDSGAACAAGVDFIHVDHFRLEDFLPE